MQSFWLRFQRSVSVVPVFIVCSICVPACASREASFDVSGEPSDVVLPDIAGARIDSSKVFAVAPRSEFTDTQRVLLTNALGWANKAMADPEILSVIRQLAEDGSLKWAKDNLRLIPDSAKHDPTGWILNRFSKEGQFSLADLYPRHSNSSTTAWTTACVPYNPRCALETDLNTQMIYVSDDRTIFAITNTLIHERIHTFGHEHISNRRSKSLCDAAYVIGDVVETLMRRETERAPVTPRESLCPAVQDRFEVLGIVERRDR